MTHIWPFFSGFWPTVLSLRGTGWLNHYILLTTEHLHIIHNIMSYICDLVLLNYRSKYCVIIYTFVSNEWRTRFFITHNINFICLMIIQQLSKARFVIFVHNGTCWTPFGICTELSIEKYMYY